MAELVDALGLGPRGRKPLQVRVLPSAEIEINMRYRIFDRNGGVFLFLGLARLGARRGK